MKTKGKGLASRPSPAGTGRRASPDRGEPAHAFEMPDGDLMISGQEAPDDYLPHGFTKSGSKIRLAPARCREIQDIRAAQRGIERVLAAAQEFTSAELTRLKKREILWWEAVTADLGLYNNAPLAKRLVYDFSCVTLKAPKAPTPETTSSPVEQDKGDRQTGKGGAA
jgi:hypothetical protein